MIETKIDIAIIGGGPAGLTAGLYAARGGMKTLLVEAKGCGGQASIADWIENYPGFSDGVSGFDLAQIFEKQALKFGLNVLTEDVTSIMPPASAGGHFVITTAEREITALSVIIATGAEHRRLDVPGENELRGKGVSYCATCDGPFFRNKHVIVAGGGNSAVQEALFLTRFAETVTLVHRRDRLRAAAILQERARSNPKIKFIWNSVITSINGADAVESATLKDLVTGKEHDKSAGGVFIFVGLAPNTAPFAGLFELDEGGYIITDAEMMTSAPGIFACGDVRHKLLRQVVTAAGDGATAAFAAQEYVEHLKGTSYNSTK